MLHQRHLRYFVKIVEAGSFSRAATLIHVAQPALSQQIADLEQALGTSLLHRSARGVRPTAAGELLYKEASAILRQIDRLPDLVRAVSEDIQGAVRLGMSSTLAADLGGTLMEACRARLPKVKLQLSTAGSLQLHQRVHDETLDLALVFEDQPVVGLRRTPLFQRRLMLVGRKTEAAHRTVARVEDLASIPLVLPILPNVTRAILDRLFLQYRLAPTIVLEAEVFNDIIAAVLAGVGQTVLPQFDLSPAPHAALAAVPIEPPVHLVAAIVAPGGRPLLPAGEAVRDLLTSFVRKHLQDHPHLGTVIAAQGSDAR